MRPLGRRNILFFAMQSQRLGNATIKLDIRSVHRKRIIQSMRTMMAIAIALSVALLPVSGAAVASVKSIPADVSMSAGMDDCCPDHAKPCPQTKDDCQSMAFCSASSINLANLAAPEFRYPPVASNPLSILTERAIPPLGGSPPFRPPRV